MLASRYVGQVIGRFLTHRLSRLTARAFDEWGGPGRQPELLRKPLSGLAADAFRFVRQLTCTSAQ